MNGLSLDIILGLALAGAVVVLLVADAIKRASRERKHRQDCAGQRRNHWSYS
jgi:hypothetical protein